MTAIPALRTPNRAASNDVASNENGATKRKTTRETAPLQSTQAGPAEPIRSFPQSKPVFRRLALNQAESAAALGISTESFARYVAAELRVVRRGRLVLYPLSELEAWLDREAERTL